MENVAQSLQGADSADSAEDSAEDMDDQHFGEYLISYSKCAQSFSNEFLLNKSPRFTKCICGSKEVRWRK